MRIHIGQPNQIARYILQCEYSTRYFINHHNLNAHDPSTCRSLAIAHVSTQPRKRHIGHPLIIRPTNIRASTRSSPKCKTYIFGFSPIVLPQISSSWALRAATQSSCGLNLHKDCISPLWSIWPPHHGIVGVPRKAHQPVKIATQKGFGGWFLRIFNESE